jgi:hypothetical protein
MSVSTPPLQACRTCEHGRELYSRRVSGGASVCAKGWLVLYRFPTHEQDDQHGFYRECEDHEQRSEVLNGEEVKG